MRAALVALAVLAASCSSGSAPTTTTDPLRSIAFEYSAAADRALDATRFETLAVTEIVDTLLGVCRSDSALDEAVAAAMATIDGAGDAPEDDAILREVVETGVAEVCPSRLASRLPTEAFADTVRTVAIDTGAELTVDEETLVAAGLVVCESLDAGVGPEVALLAAVSILFDVDAESVADLEGLLGADEGVIAGATLASAAAHLCPAHAAAVTAYVEGL